MVALISTISCCGLGWACRDSDLCVYVCVSVCELCHQFDMLWNALIDPCLFLLVRLVM